MPSPADPPASFTRAGGLLVPDECTRGGWTADTLLGRYLAGLVAWGAERHGADDLQPARLTVDMFRPAPMAPLRVDTEVVRDGRRIRVVDASIVVDDRVVCRGSVAFLRRSAEPRGRTWLPPEWSVADPEDLEAMSPDPQWTPPWELRPVTPFGSVEGRRRVWLRETRAFVAGEPTSPFVRAALAADNANGQVNAGPIGLAYINADLTMTLARLPEDEWIGLDTTSRAAADGVAVGTVDLYDGKGRIGQVAMIGTADERNLPPEDPAAA